MDLSHRFSVPAPVEEAWTAFNHLDRLAPCFPGATISATHSDHFEGWVKVKLGPTALVYSGSGQFLERDSAARRVVFEARGDDRRGNGTATARVTASFAGNGSGTDIELRTTLDLTGRPAQFGGGVIADVSDKLLDQFATCLAGRFAEGLGLPAAAPPGSAGSGAADDELWEEWAQAEDRRDGVDPSDSEQTLEMATVGPVAPDPSPYRYRRSGSRPRPDAVVATSAVATALRRYGLPLGVALVVVIALELLRRRRR